MTTTITYHTALSEDEARQLTNDIRQHLAHLDHARRKIGRIWVTEAWMVLGYNSFRQWALQEYGEKSVSQVYRLKDAAMVDMALDDSDDASDGHDGDGSHIPETWARDLKQIPPDDVSLVMDQARKLALSEGGTEPVRRHVKTAVSNYHDRQHVDNSPYKVISHMLNSGDLTAPTAKAMCDELDRQPPDARVYICRLATDYGLSSPELIAPLAGKYNARRDGHDSKVLRELEATGTLNQTPLARADLRDLKAANRAAHREYQTEGIEKKRQKLQSENEPPPPEPVAMNAIKHDAAQTLKNLTHAITAKDMDDLFRLLAAQRGYTLFKGDVLRASEHPDGGYVFGIRSNDVALTIFDDDETVTVLAKSEPVNDTNGA